MKISILLILFSVLVSCEEENSKRWTEVTITAKDYISDEPISDINCGIVTVKDGLFLNSETVILDERQLENGTYHYGFKADKNQTYWAEANFDILKYYPIKFSNSSTIENNVNNEFNFKLAQSGYLNVDFENINCEDANDALSYRYYAKDQPTDIDYIYIYNWIYNAKIGCVNEVYESYQKLPAVNYTIEWSVQRTSGTTYGSDTFLVTDSTTYLLAY